MEAKCYYCEKELNTRSATRHIKSCKDRLEKVQVNLDKSKTSVRKFIIKINDRYRKDYVLYIAIDENATLKDLDILLRKVWLECCGHLSSFKIDGYQFFSDDGEDSIFNSENNYNFNYILKNLLDVKTKFSYDYDFGSTTELELEVIDLFNDGDKSSKIEILARNNFIEPTNSQRDGVCGYYGNEKNEEKYLPGNKTKLCKIEVEDYIERIEEPIFHREEFVDDIFNVNNNGEEDLVAGFRAEMLAEFAKAMTKEMKVAVTRDKDGDLKSFLMSLSKDEIKFTLDNLDIRYKASDKKEKLANIFVMNHRKAYLEFFKYINKDLYNDLLFIKKKFGVISPSQMESLKCSNELDGLGMLYAVLDDFGDLCLVMPEEIIGLIEEIDVKRIEHNEEIVNVVKGMTYYYGVFTIKEFVELLPKDIDIQYDFDELDKLLSIVSKIGIPFRYNSHMVAHSEITVEDEVERIHYKKRDKEYKRFSKAEILKASEVDYIGGPSAYKEFKKYIKEYFTIDKETLRVELEEMYYTYQTEPRTFIDFVFSRFEIPEWEKDNFIQIINRDFNKIPVWLENGFSKNEMLNPNAVIAEGVKVGRNDPCICGSGKKYKKCCASKVIKVDFN